MSFNKPSKITETSFSDRTKSSDQLQTAAWEASTIEFLSFYSKYFLLVYWRNFKMRLKSANFESESLPKFNICEEF